MVRVYRGPDLSQVRSALSSPRSFARGLDRWQQQAGQESDDCHNHQQFEERK
jgi:hypothetical protein